MAVVVLQSMSWLGGFLLASFLTVVLILYFALSRFFPRRFRLEGSHVIVTGGSSGIGLACAVECARRGAHVTLVARDLNKLVNAREIVLAASANPELRVRVLSCDVARDYETTKSAFDAAAAEMGDDHPADALINCAGSGPGGAFDAVPPTEFERLMRLNYLTAVHSTRAVLPGMKERRRGRILFASSQAGQLGLYGYTAYSAAKFALRGLAEALQMEVKPFNVFVTLAFPPDTDTPGFAEESQSLPPETKEISATSGLWSAPDVAEKMVDSLVAGNFFCFIGLDGFLLGTLTAGMAPVTSFLDVVVQFVCMSVFRLVGVFYLTSFDGICHKWKRIKDGEDPE